MRAFVSSLLLGAICCAITPVAAQNIDHRASLGIEVPAISVRHLSVSSLGKTTTGMGLFASGADLNGQFGLSNSSILGLRLGVSRQTESLSGASATSAQSQLSLSPRFEFYMAPEHATRPHIGIEAGFARSTSNTSSAGLNEWLIGPTGGVAYFAYDYWEFDVNGSLFLGTGSQGPVSTSGYGFILRVDMSAWFGGAATPTKNVPQSEGGLGLSGAAPLATSPAPTAANGAEWKGAAPVPPSNSPVPATTPSAAPAGATTPTPAAAAPEPTVAAAEALTTKEGRRLTLDLHEGRRLTLIATTTGSERKVKFILVKTPLDASLKWCSAVGLHAPDQSESKIDVRYKLLSTPSGEVATLSAEVPADVLKPLIEAPLPKKPQLTPDHWLSVCGQDWPLSTLERRQLKEFLNK